MTKRISSGFLFFMLITGTIFFHSCNSSNNQNVYACNNEAVPDTSNMYKLANFTSKSIRKTVINEEMFLDNGEKRKKGITAIPQDKDDFRFADLDEVYWNGIHIQNADFRGSSFRSAKCDDADLSHSDFRFSDMKWSSFNRSNLSSCLFGRGTLFRIHVNDANLECSDFRGANMFGVIGHRANFRNSDFTNALMKESEFTDADFTGSKMVHVKFIITVFAGAKLDSSDFSYSDFTGAGLEETSFINSRLWNVDFRGAHLQEADFRGADIKGCNFFAVEFMETDFTDAINIPPEIQELIIDNKITGVCSVGSNDD
ncbi:MAG: hypothetical protein DRI89_01445 [Bacteroidetes bacterium]|nr:MAG: hypothetical protein DRI89_01445 [Bacteroidota bacterium]